MKRVLVTGGAGFVGANLARWLLRDGHELHLLLRRDSDRWRLEQIEDEVRIHWVDLEDENGVGKAAAAVRAEWVFHLAAHGGYSSQTDRHRIVRTNILGTMNLLEACLGVGFEAFVNTGSSSEYGFKDHAPSEEEPIEPNSYYAVSKASATLYCRYVAQRQGARIPTLRLYSVYGPFEDPRRLIPTLIVRGLHGQLPPLVSPDVARDYVYVDDVNRAYLLAATQPAEEPGAVYNVGTGRQTPLRGVVEIARRQLGIRVEPRWGTMPGRQWDTDTWQSDNRKIRRHLGWEPRYALEQGLSAFLAWFREHPGLRQRYEEILLPKV